MIYKFEDGITVAELKEIIKDWKETRLDGTPTRVLIGDIDDCSNEVTEVGTIDMDMQGRADLMISMTRI